MSVKASTWAWEQSEATGNEFVVLLAIAEAANSDGENSCQSVARLVRMARCSESTVHRAIKSLLDRGEIEKAGVNARYFNTTIYRLPGVSGGVSSGGCQSDTPVTSTPGGVSPVTPEPTTKPTTTGTGSTEEVAVPNAPDRPEHGRHPSRPINTWAPVRALVDHLALAYPHVNVPASYTRFFNFHFAKQDTSKSWDALFENWVSNDEERAVDRLDGGTDDRGIPVTQSGKSIVPPALQPGDDGYFNPLDR